MTDKVDVLIVGAGQGGAQVAISLRQGGFAGSISMIGDEPDEPYDRPPLSKDYLAGEKRAEKLLLRHPDFWEKNDIDLKVGTRVASIDADAHVVEIDDGRAVHYRYLVWAAGGFARALPLPGGDLEGIHVIRTRAQVDLLRADVESAQDIVVIGGGYVGLEAAAVLIKQSKKVTLLEMEDRVLARVAGKEISEFYEAEHRAQGVNIRTGVGVEKLLGHEGRVNAVILGNGEELHADLVIAGIGLVPNQKILSKAGAKCSNGIEVDEFCRTSLPDVFSVGDCACHPNIYAEGKLVRLESVPNAIGQARTVASVILGDPKAYRDLPWFWSNQYDLKLQTAGLNHGYDETVLRGDPATRSFSLIYLRKGKVIAVDAVSAIKDFIIGKKLVENGVSPNVEEIADPLIDMKEFLD